MKKIISLVIAVMMLVGMVACAQAANSPTVPSPTVTYPTVENAPTFVLEQVEVTPEAEAVQAELVAAATEGKLVEFFGAAAEGIDLTAAQVDEFLPMNIDNYSFVYGDVKATIECVTEYKAGDKLVAMLGSVKGNTTTWYALEAEVDAEGKVVVTFTEEVLLAVTGTEVVMALVRIA